MKDVIEYHEKTLSSGKAVHIRPRDYDTWEKQEEARLKLLEGVDVTKAPEGSTVLAVELALQRANMAVRGTRLASWVKDFDKEKKKLSLRDIAEIEKIALELESVEIPLGNLEDGGNGA